jgi:hypothetical protein
MAVKSMAMLLFHYDQNVISPHPRSRVCSIRLRPNKQFFFEEKSVPFEFFRGMFAVAAPDRTKSIRAKQSALVTPLRLPSLVLALRFPSPVAAVSSRP